MTPHANQFPKMANGNPGGSDACDLPSFAMQVDSGMQNESGNESGMQNVSENSEAERLAKWYHAEFFPRTVTVQQLGFVWVSRWLTGNTDFSREELLLIELAEPEAPLQMFLFETQWPPTLRLNADCLHMETFGRMSTRRSWAGGKRLNELKARGGYQRGVIDWTFGCYDFPMDEAGQVLAIKHITGTLIEVPSYLALRRGFFDVQANWDDFGARLRMPPLQLKLWKLMENECKAAKTGPWALEYYTGGNCKRFNAAFAEEYNALLASRRVLAHSRVSDGVFIDMQQLHEKKRDAGLSKWRKQCVELLEAKAGRGRITVQLPAEDVAFLAMESESD